MAGVASFFYTVYSNRRERAARQAGLEREEANRREEIGLLRQQVETAQEEREERKTASMVAFRTQTSGGASYDTYTFVLSNIGQAAAQRVTALIRDVDGNHLSQPTRLAAPALKPGEDAEIAVEVPTRAVEHSRGAFLHVAWEDDRGLQAHDLLGLKPIR